MHGLYYTTPGAANKLHSTHATLHAARLAQVALLNQWGSGGTHATFTARLPAPLPQLYWHTRLLLLAGWYRCQHCGCKYCGYNY